MRNYIRIFFVTLITVFFISCQEDSNSTICDVDEPAEDLPWMKTMIEEWKDNSTIYPYMYIQQGTYIGQTVFLANNCCPFCDSYVPVFNCSGEEIEGVDFQEISNLKTIWKPFNSKCTL